MSQPEGRDAENLKVGWKNGDNLKSEKMKIFLKTQN